VTASRARAAPRALCRCLSYVLLNELVRMCDIEHTLYLIEPAMSLTQLFCFGCMTEVSLNPSQLPTGQWVAECEKCGVVNKYEQDADVPTRFTNSGAFINIKPAA